MKRKALGILCVAALFSCISGCKKEQEPKIAPTEEIIETESGMEQVNIEVKGSYKDDNIALNYIPDGFILTERSSRKRSANFTFNKGEEYFAIGMRMPSATMMYDTEDAVVEELWINGEEAVYSTNERANILVWSGEERVFKISGNITQEEMVKIAQNIQRIKK